MAQRVSRGLSGRIEIIYSWDESSNSHVENTHSIELLTENNKIILREHNSHQNFLKSNLSHSSTKSYEIDAGKLLSLIKEHEKLSD